MKKPSLTMIVLILTSFMSTVSHTQDVADIIINLNARDHSSSSSPFVMTFGPGTYTVTPIGIAEGGEFNAWNARGFNSGCNPEGSGCTTGWQNEYVVFTSDFGLFPGDGDIYASDVLALVNARATLFTIQTERGVSFSFTDDINPLDNRGGMSLRVSLVAIVPPPCDGLQATIVGTEGDDLMTGTEGNDPRQTNVQNSR